MDFKSFSAKEIIEKAKEIKDHLDFINKEESIINWNNNYFDLKVCFYSIQNSKKPN